MKLAANKYMESTTMTKPLNHDRPRGNPTLWTVAARRWTLESPEQELAIGQDIQIVEIADRELAVAIAHHLLDKHAHEAFGMVSLEIHVMPPTGAPGAVGFPSPQGQPRGT
jgi:hypothetical protein